MMKPIKEEHIAEVVAVIRESFLTVAERFGFTEENCPRFTAFATDEHRIRYQLMLEQRPAYGYFADGKLVGYYSLSKPENKECEISNLCVLPDYRHRGIGEELLCLALERAAELGCVKMNIGYVAENTQLREWYESFGFVYLGAKKFEHFIFTCGYMEKPLSEADEE